MRRIPNILSFCRIFGSLILFFVEPFCALFYSIYIVCGISDAFDGYLARKFNSTNRIGSVLDSVADLVFYSSLLFHLFPCLYHSKISVGVWYAVSFVILLRIITYSLSLIKFKKFSSLHTHLNKATGFSIFIYPILMFKLDIDVLAYIVCVIAFLATFEELLIHLSSKTYPEEKKSLYAVRHKTV